MGLHEPPMPGTSQRSHVPQEESQQTPSTQKPLSHSAPSAHPLACTAYSQTSADAVSPPKSRGRPRPLSKPIACPPIAPGKILCERSCRVLPPHPHVSAWALE